MFKNGSMIKFLEYKDSGYKGRTLENAKADCTIAIAADFLSAGEKCTKNCVSSQNKLYIPIDISQSLTVESHDVQFIVNSFNKGNVRSLNLAGNGIYTFKGLYTQQQLDYYTYTLLSEVVSHKNLQNPILSIRTGGQTGIDESGAKAGYLLNIPTTVLAPKGWKFRDINGVDISDEGKFKARFYKVLSWDRSNWEKFLEEVNRYKQ